MNNKLVKKLFISMLVVFISGFILILSSNTLSNKIGYRTLNKNGGCMDTSEYERILSSITLNCQLCGSLLSLFGGAGTLIIGNKLLVKNITD